LTLELHEFPDIRNLSYAILSHTWGDGEITFQDWLYTRNQDPPRWGLVRIEKEINQLKLKPGYIKILKACQQAQRHGYNWIWVDTTCIDKTSSAELSEAINSMSKWYMDAAACYAFLADVPNLAVKECHASDSPFRRSRWFKRGWTLQELVAPNRLEFYSKDWRGIGSKKDLSNLIAEITRVPEDCLENPKFVPDYTIAARMSWASRRETTRAEDLAYCLLGIFEVHMPLLYGEGGENAFMRLQEEIMRESTDHSLFAWRRSPPADNGSEPSANPLAWGILATHPSQFEHATSIRNLAPLRNTFSLTSRGLRIKLPILRRHEWDRHAIAILDCGLDGWAGLQLGFFISQLGVTFEEPHLFVRTLHWNIYQVSPEEKKLAQVQTIYLLKRDLYRQIDLPERPKKKEDEAFDQTINDLGTFPILSIIFPGSS
jgi:hypothetical protein